jgi:hypothetical protein
MVVVVDVRKKKNNAVSILASGLCSGLTELDVEHRIVRYSREWLDGRRQLDPEEFLDADVILLPYWISGGIWRINLAEVRRAAPSARIVCFTGTSPFWNGSVPSYVPSTRGFDRTGMSAEEAANFDAVDLFAVVRRRPGVAPLIQRQVGMGLPPEVGVGMKSPHPIVVLDAMKPGWDEAAYADSLAEVRRALAAVPDLRVVALGITADTASLAAEGKTIVLPGEFMPFEDMARLWSSSWAFVCHNESFGYPVVENIASGTRVFASPLADVPEWHRPRVAAVSDLTDHLLRLSKLSSGERQVEATEMAFAYLREEPYLHSWRDAVEKILE